MKNKIKSIRIISGKWKRKKILTYVNEKIRPTNDRMRETLFNWLSPFIHCAKCLDCYSGSGILGIESLSRDAAFVTALEKNIKIYKQIKKNVSMLLVKNILLINTNTINFLNKKGNPYDIIFVDPPFYSKFLQKTIFLLEKNNWIKKYSLIYLEYESSFKNLYIPDTWKIYREKISKNVIYKLFLRKFT